MPKKEKTQEEKETKRKTTKRCEDNCRRIFVGINFYLI